MQRAALFTFYLTLNLINFSLLLIKSKLVPFTPFGKLISVHASKVDVCTVYAYIMYVCMYVCMYVLCVITMETN